MRISSGGHANFVVIVLVNFYFLILKIKLWQKIKNLKGKVTTVTQVEAAVEIRVKTATAAANHPKGKMYLLTEIQKGSTSSSGGGRTSQSGFDIKFITRFYILSSDY